MTQFYARVHVQILDSSIAEDFTLRHVFEDFLKVCDLNGTVDMTRSALARRFNMPKEALEGYIAKLEAPDPHSRDEEYEGRRIERLDAHREWGWRILNWPKYERLKTRADAARRMAMHRERKKSGSASALEPSDGQQRPQQASAEIPSLEEVKTEASKIGLAEWVATMWWTEMEGLGWKVKGQNVAQWRKLLAVKRTWWEADGRPMQPKGRNAANQPNPRPGADRSANTLNAGKSGQYAGIGRMGKV